MSRKSDTRQDRAVKKAPPDRPWYVLPCSQCRQLKHTLEFRIRRTLLGQRTICKVCEAHETKP